MDSILQSVYDFINTCPYVGWDMYFNFITQENTDNNTSLQTIGYGDIVKKYVDGDKLLKAQFEIRQVKPLSIDSNTLQNVEQLEYVQKFMNWINEQGKNNNFPDFGENKTVQKMGTPDEVIMPMLSSYYENSALYGFPFEILYLERT